MHASVRRAHTLTPNKKQPTRQRMVDIPDAPRTRHPCWAAARRTPSCKDGGARMARALQAEGGDGLVAGLAGRPRSNGLRWAGAPHSLAPRSSCCRNAQAHVAAVAVRPKSPHESPQLLEVKSPVIKRRMVGGWCRRGLRCAAGAGAPIG